MATLVSLANFKTRANVSGTAQDSQYTLLLEDASAMIRRACGRDMLTGFETATRTERHNGLDTGTIQLAEWPVTSVTSVSHTVGGASSLVDATTYRVALLSGIVGMVEQTRQRFAGGSAISGDGAEQWLASPRFVDGFQNYTVVYVGGYATIPADIQSACSRITSLLAAATSPNASVKSVSIGQFSKSFDTSKEIDAIIESLAQRYRTGGT